MLNGSFEESDLAPDFIDCWHIVRGSAKRTAGDAHHGSYAMRLSSGAELAYAARTPLPSRCVKAKRIVDLSDESTIAQDTDAFTVDPGAKGTCLFQIR